MSWVKLDDKFTGHTKVLAAGPEAAWLHIEGLCYCAQQETDGVIPNAALAHLTQFSKARAEKLASKLIKVGLWEMNGAGWMIHDYLDYNPSRASLEIKRKAARERMAKK